MCRGIRTQLEYQGTRTTAHSYGLDLGRWWKQPEHVKQTYRVLLTLLRHYTRVSFTQRTMSRRFATVVQPRCTECNPYTTLVALLQLSGCRQPNWRAPGVRYCIYVFLFFLASRQALKDGSYLSKKEQKPCQWRLMFPSPSFFASVFAQCIVFLCPNGAFQQACRNIPCCFHTVSRKIAHVQWSYFEKTLPCPFIVYTK